MALGFSVLFAMVSLGAIDGEVRRSSEYRIIFILPDVATWMPYVFDAMGYRTFANLREADVSTKPSNWTGVAARLEEDLKKSGLLEKARAELAQVKGAPLKGANLRYADAALTFLVRADLRGAKLQGADLFRANLRYAILDEAKLQGATLIYANLQGATLGIANLQEADLIGAKLQGAILFRANLQGADLRGANLTEVKELTQLQLDQACGDEETKLPDGLTIATCREE